MWASSAALAILATALLVVSMAGTGATFVAARQRASAGPAPAIAPEAPAPRNLTFYMHNNTVARSVNGVSTPYLFDTLQRFGQNDTVTKLQNVRQDWYLYPALAGDLAVNGSITLHAFVSVSQVGAQVTPTLTVSEVDPSGATVWSASVGGGAVAWWATPHDLVMTLPGVQRTFSAGSTILVLLDVVSGSRVVTIWYNATWVPTHLVVESDSFAQVGTLAFLDSGGVARVSFDPLAANKAITIRANVTDPLGGYDIQWVNLTLQRPDGSRVLTDAPMAKTAGTPLSFQSTYELAWNYAGQPVGRYNATASVLDRSGYYHFQESYTTDGFLARLTASFYIGGLPYYVWVLVLDGRGLPLGSAAVAVTSAGTPLDSGVTDVRGMVNLTAFAGTYGIQVVWTGVTVAQVALTVSANITEGAPLVVGAAVYYPVLRTADASGMALANAALYLTYPNGTAAALPVFTNGTGEAALGRLAGGALGVRALWRGDEVARISLTVDRNSPPPFLVPCAVYYLTLTVSDSRAAPVADAQVVLSDAVYGLVADAQITDGNGRVVSRLPAGTYAVDVTWNGVAVSSGTTVHVTSSGNATILANVYYLTVSAVDSQSKAVAGAHVVALAASGRIFTAADSDGSGRAVLRVPATTVRLEADWLGVSVGAMNVAVSGDASIVFDLQVYTLNVTVQDANGAPLSGAQVTVEVDGRIFALEVTDGSGLASVRLPVGNYTVRARFTASYLYTFVDTSDGTTVDLTQDMAKTIQLGAYPPPVTGTVAFGFSVLVVVLAVGLSWGFYMLGKRRAKRPETKETPEEPKEPEEPRDGSGPP